MKLYLRIIFVAGTALALSACKPDKRDVLSPKEKEQQLTSVLLRGKEVFVANPSGLFRASLSDKTWHKLALPASMPPAGSFAGGDPSNDLYYYANKENLLFYAPEAKDKKIGLYQSADDGKTWNLISEDDGYSEVFVHPHGDLYAVIAGLHSADKKEWRSELRVSIDHGKTWRPILNTQSTMYNIFADPDHPDLVCVETNFIRSYVEQAVDSKYEWKSTVEWEWNPAHETDKSFFTSYYGTTSVLYMLQATLANYFDHDFKGGSAIPGFAIVPKKLTYDFKKDEAMPVEVSVVFRPPGATVTLADQDEKVGIWRLGIIGPDGTRKSSGGSMNEQYYKAQDRQKLGAELKTEAGFKTHTLTVDQPYTRVIDLAALYQFPKPGTYKVQLGYDSSCLKSIGIEGWGGYFSSDVFTVNIK